MENKYIIRDRMGYLIEVAAASPSEAIKKSADPIMAFFVSEAGEISQEEFEKNNCLVSMNLDGTRCRCGHHEEEKN